MDGAERVVDVDVRERREPRGERRVVRLLAGMEAQVLEEEHVPIGKRVHGLFGDRSYAVGRERTGRRELGEARARPVAGSARDRNSPFGRPRWEHTMTRAPRARSASSVGSAPRMRVSSVILPPASGTLKSARTRTRLPSPGSESNERGSFTAARRESTRRFEKPHSLSYHDTTLAVRPAPSSAGRRRRRERRRRRCRARRSARRVGEEPAAARVGRLASAALISSTRRHGRAGTSGRRSSRRASARASRSRRACPSLRDHEADGRAAPVEVGMI